MAAPITVTLPAATMEVEALERLCREARAAATTPPFAVGDWIVNTKERGRNAVKVTNVRDCTVSHRPWCSVRTGRGMYAVDARPATPEEILVATRIVPKVGMILREKVSGDVMRIASLEYGPAGGYPKYASWTRLFPWHGTLNGCDVARLSTEDLEIVARYTIEGVV